MTGHSNTIPRNESDPLLIICLVALVFFLLGLVRLEIPYRPYFDEHFYVDAAKSIIIGIKIENGEHPMVAKEIIAAFLQILGKNPYAWRIPALLSGTAGLIFFTRAMWNLSNSKISTIIFCFVLSTNFLLFGLSRLGLLDIFMFCFTALSVYLFTVALCRSDSSRRYFVLSGVSLGLAVGSKWSCVPVFVSLVGIYVWLNWRSVRAMSWGVVYFLIVPGIVYCLSFAPAVYANVNSFGWSELIRVHLAMIDRLSLYVRGHPYASQWWQWPLGLGQIWPLRQEEDGFYRVSILGQNPVTTVAASCAAVWGLGAFLLKGDWRIGVPATIWAVCIGFWALSQKPVQFLFHYLLAATFALAVLSQLLGRLWQIGCRWPAIITTLASVACFAWFFPALTAAQLSERKQEELFTWPPGWKPLNEVKKYYRIAPHIKQSMEQNAECLSDMRNIHCL